MLILGQQQKACSVSRLLEVTPRRFFFLKLYPNVVVVLTMSTEEAFCSAWKSICYQLPWKSKVMSSLFPLALRLSARQPR